MNEERMKILQLLQDGKISVDEAMQLLEATTQSQNRFDPPPARQLSVEAESDESEEPCPRPAMPRISLSNLSGAYFGGVKLEGALLDGANLSGAYLGNADLRGADLRNADLSGVHLGGANLHNANLRNANLSGAHLENADFENADLTEVDLSGACIPGVKYRNGTLQFA